MPFGAVIAGFIGATQRVVSRGRIAAWVEMPPSYRFEPSAICVPAGTTVAWINTDHVTRSVQVAGGPGHLVKPGERRAITFDSAYTRKT
jgi:plastocyanin